MIGNSITRLFSPARMPEKTGLASPLIAGIGVPHFETQRIMNDGCVIEILAAQSPVSDAGGTIFAIAEVARDISPWKRMQEELAKTKMEAFTAAMRQFGVRDLLNDRLDHAAVCCFRDVAAVCEITAIAEFVESEEVRAELTRIGITLAQGYLIHRPEPFERLLKDRQRWCCQGFLAGVAVAGRWIDTGARAKTKRGCGPPPGGEIIKHSGRGPGPRRAEQGERTCRQSCP